MIRRLLTSAAVALVIAVMAACASSTTQPAAPTAVSAPTQVSQVSTNLTVDGVLGDWQADALTDPDAIIAAEAAAPRTCNEVEFKVVRDADSLTGAVVFVGTCARIRIRAEGKGTMSGDTLLWRAQGKVTLPTGRTCAAVFGDGSKAQPASAGMIKVTYKGTICDAPVAGVALVRKR